MSGEENVPTSSKEIKKRRSYTIDQKLEVIKFARSSSRNAASRKFNIARHCVSQWMRNEQSLIELQYVL
jgi:transposase-like protein